MDREEGTSDQSEDLKKEHDFEAALKRALADDEQVEALWQVSPGRYLLGMLYLSRFFKAGAIIAPIILAGAIYGMTQVSQSFWQGTLTLPTTTRQWCLLFVFVPLILFCIYMAVTETLRVITARCVLTQRRWLSFQNLRGRGWRAKAIRLDRCAWRFENHALMIYELSPRRTIREFLPVLGLASSENLRELLTEHAGPELDLEAARSYEQQYEEEDLPAGALTALFRKRIRLDWLEREKERVHKEGCTRLLTGVTLLWVGFLSYLVVTPTTTRQWVACGVGAVVITVAYRWWETWKHQRATAPVRCLAEGHWWQLERRESLRSRYVPAAVLPLSGLQYVVHEETVYVPHGPLQVEAGWSEGETDAVGKIADACQALPARARFSPADWHALHPARPRLLQRLEEAGAIRAAS